MYRFSSKRVVPLVWGIFQNCRQIHCWLFFMVLEMLEKNVDFRLISLTFCYKLCCLDYCGVERKFINRQWCWKMGLWKKSTLCGFPEINILPRGEGIFCINNLITQIEYSFIACILTFYVYLLMTNAWLFPNQGFVHPPIIHFYSSNQPIRNSPYSKLWHCISE